jgi:hypothetical protein
MSEGHPVLRVVRGEPTVEELAALLAVVTARAATAPSADRPGSAWADPAGQLRRPVPHGASGLRRSALPR